MQRVEASRVSKCQEKSENTLISSLSPGRIGFSSKSDR